MKCPRVLLAFFLLFGITPAAFADVTVEELFGDLMITNDLLDPGHVTLRAPGGNIFIQASVSAGTQLMVQASGFVNQSTGLISARALHAGAGSHITFNQLAVGALIATNVTGDILLSATNGLLISEIRAPGGNIGVMAGSTLTAQTVFASGQVGLTNTSNDIFFTALTAGNTLTLNSSGGLSGGTVTAATLHAYATYGINLQSRVGALTATNGAGNIIIHEADAVTLTSLRAGNGSITVTAGGLVQANEVRSLTDNAANDITLTGSGFVAGSIVAGSAGDATIQAGPGALTDGTGKIVANHLTVGANQSLLLDTSVISLMATNAVANITVSESDAIVLTGLRAGNGSINITAGGQITATEVRSLTDNNSNDINLTGQGFVVGEIQAGVAGDVTLQAGAGSLFGTPGAIGADELSMQAGGSIGLSTQALRIAVRLLAASSGGDLYLTASNALAIGTSGAVSGLGAAGHLVVLAQGAITNTRSISAGGNLLLKSTAGQLDCRMPVTSSNGCLSLQAQNNLILHSNLLIQSSVGNLVAEASAGSIIMSNAASATTAGGNIRLLAGMDMALARINAGAGSISVTAAGDIYDANADSLNLIGSGLRAVAGRHFSSAGDRIETSVDLLAAQAGGLLIVDEQWALTVGSTAVTVQRCLEDGSTEEITDPALTGLGSGSNLLITVNSGDLVLNQPIRAGRHVLGQAQSGSLTQNAEVFATNGCISLLAEGDITQNANDTAWAGNVDIEATSGSVLMATGTTVQAGSYNARVSAGQDIHLELILCGAGQLSLVAGGQITDHNGAANNITAYALLARAGGGVGSASNALETMLDVYCVESVPPPFFQHSAPGTHVGLVGPVAVNRVQSNGDLDEVTDVGLCNRAHVVVLDTNRQVIAHADAQPSPGDGTDFGPAARQAGHITRWFGISNAGPAALTISAVSPTGSHASDFHVLNFPTHVPAGGYSNLAVRFAPSNTGLRSATLSIINNDPLLGTYTFALQGTGTLPVVHYVWTNSPSPAPPHTTWLTAAHDFHAATDATIPGDEVVVTSGVYASSTRWAGGTSNRWVVPSCVTVRSVQGADSTRIEGDLGMRGVYLSEDTALVGFTVSGANVPQPGAGVYAETNARVEQCVLSHNQTTNIGGGAYGGRLVNCLVVSNSAHQGGGGARATVIHCTIENNSAVMSGGGTYQCDLLNSIAYYNTGGNAGSGSATASCLAEAAPGIGNITNPPVYMNPNAGDFRLLYDSPCIDAGAESGQPRDLANTPRPQARIFGGPTYYDMGAYEYAPAARYVWTNGSHQIPFDGWSTAATNLQAALDVSAGGDRILVGDGVYDPFSSTNAVIIKSLHGPETTIIDGRGAIRGVDLGGGARMDGFRVRHGWATECGGVRARGASVINDCIIENNEATGTGGGLCLTDNSLAIDCTISSNRAWNGAGVYASTGTVQDSTLRWNIGTSGAGGGAYLDTGAAMERCLVVGNSNRFGGGVFVRNATLDNGTMVSNRAELQGGALSLQGGLVRNSLLVGNQAGSQGGGVYAGATGLLINLTIAANLSLQGGGVYLTDSAELWNSIVISNVTDNITHAGPIASVQYTLSVPVAPGPGNLGTPPLLCDAPDYHLTADSPALNAGSNHTALLGTRRYGWAGALVCGAGGRLRPVPTAHRPGGLGRGRGHRGISRAGHHQPGARPGLEFAGAGPAPAAGKHQRPRQRVVLGWGLFSRLSRRAWN
jgi:hypothetical protein